MAPSEVVVRDFTDSSRAYEIKLDGGNARSRIIDGSLSEARVLGFGCWQQTSIGETFLAYFAGSRASAESAPDYDQQLWLVVNSSIFDLSGGKIFLDLKQSLRGRTFSVRQNDRTIISFAFKHSLFHGLANRLFGDPFLAERDVIDAAVALARPFQGRG